MSQSTEAVFRRHFPVGTDVELLDTGPDGEQHLYRGRIDHYSETDATDSPIANILGTTVSIALVSQDGKPYRADMSMGLRSAAGMVRRTSKAVTVTEWAKVMASREESAAWIAARYPVDDDEQDA